MKRIRFGDDAPEGYYYAMYSSVGTKVHLINNRHAIQAICGVRATRGPEYLTGYLCTMCASRVVPPEPELPSEPGSDHYVVGEVKPRLDLAGNPRINPLTRLSARVECVVCLATGHLTTSAKGWLRAHAEHVRCVCGAIVTKKGFPSHISGARQAQKRREAG